jgi:hypothetical protein
MRMTHLMPAVLASTLLVAPMLAYAQAPATPPAGGTGSTLGQSVTPGQPAPPAAGIGPGTTPGGAPGQMPGQTTGQATPGQTGGTTTMTPGTPASPGTAGMTAPGTTAGQAAFPAGSAVMARPRMSQIIGSNVYNEENNSIGSVDDIVLVPPAGASAQGPMAIVQVGGFLGMGGRLVSVPLRDLQWNAENSRMVLPGATRDSLRERPEFDYDTVRTTR